jgi:hypothetical protein
MIHTKNKTVYATQRAQNTVNCVVMLSRHGVLYTEASRETIAIYRLVYINQAAACCMSVYLSTTSVQLHSVENESMPVMLHATDGSVECNIFHSVCTEVEIDGVVGTWQGAECSYDCMQLACQHTFNACALALHFLTNNMTCPLCRSGAHAKMSLACVPDNIKCVYLKHISSNVNADLLEFTPEVFLADLRLRVDFVPFSTDTREIVTLTSPCIAEADTEDVFRTHHSFRRQFNRNLNSASPSACRFSLIHPLIATPLCSEDLVSDELRENQFSLPHDIAVVCCHMQHDILTINLQLNLNVLYSMCVSSVMQYMDEN